MNTLSAVAVARAWISDQGVRIPGFCGAHLMGSTLSMPSDAEFPSYGDLDFNIVVEGDQPTETYNVLCNGVILEYSIVSRAQYTTPEAVLANPELAWNLAQPGVLVDHDGALTALNAAVSRQYGERRWVMARCAAEKAIVGQFLGMLDAAQQPADAAWGISGCMMFLAGLLAVAHGAAPTHRRCLVLLRQFLQTDGYPELYEQALQLLGYAGMTQEQVESYLDRCAEAFDRVVALRGSPPMFPFKFQAHARPYVIEGAREMIRVGDHREAMYWIEGWLTFSNMALRSDAPAGELPAYQAVIDALLRDKGADRPGYVANCQAAGHRLADQVYAIADAVAASASE
jgi:hypothetical protein